jgi:chromosome segregation ATPase
MAKRRLIKKINEVSEEDLLQELDLAPDQPQNVPTSNSRLLAEQEQEITRLRELLEEYRMQEADFKQQKEESFRLTQQNKQLQLKIENYQKEFDDFKEENNHLATQLKQKETELLALETTTVDIDEVEQLKQEIDRLKNEQALSNEQIMHLETALIEKDQALTTKIADKEVEIQQLQEQLAVQGTIGEKQEALETVKMELRSLNEELQNTDKENQELTDKLAELQEQMQQLQQENQALKEKELNLTANTNTSVDNSRVDELKQELQTVLREKSELETTLGRIQGLNDRYSVQKDVFESELAALRESYKEKEAELASLSAEMETMRNMSASGEVKGAQLAELLQAKQQINDLLLKNQSLQEEALKSQQEIGEVMVSAKKEANRIVSEAQVEAKHIINSAELEMLNIGNRAKNISNEVEESKNEVLTIYRELEERLSKLSRLDKTGK